MKQQAHILVVDDDYEIRDLLDRYLTKSGYLVSVAEDGEAMHAHLTSHGYPALILLDVMLPGDDGFVLCQQIRKNSTSPLSCLPRYPMKPTRSLV